MQAVAMILRTQVHDVETYSEITSFFERYNQDVRLKDRFSLLLGSDSPPLFTPANSWLQNKMLARMKAR